MNTINFLINKYTSKMADNDQKFLKRVYDYKNDNNSLKKYEERLKQIDFINKNSILDFGAGFGQWSLALSKFNKNVIAYEPDDVRYGFTKKMTEILGKNNVNVFNSHDFLKHQKDDTFDAIFCYGVIFLTDWKKTINEFFRILKKNGALYFNANDIGWYIFVWETLHNKASDFNPQEMVCKTFNDTLKYNNHNIYRNGMKMIMQKDVVLKYLQNKNFNSIQFDQEGMIKSNKYQLSTNPFSIGRYKDLTAVYEILAIK